MFKHQLVRVITILSILLSLLSNFVQTPTPAAAQQPEPEQQLTKEQPPVKNSGPVIGQLIKAQSFTDDLRKLTRVKPIKKERPELEEPEAEPRPLKSPKPSTGSANSIIPSRPSASDPVDNESHPSLEPIALLRPEQSGLKILLPTIGVALPPAVSQRSSEVYKKKLGQKLAAPSPLITFDGLDFATWGAGHPPDTNGDVGPTYYIQTVNTAIGIYTKTTGSLAAAFTFDTFMSQGNFGNLCDTDNFGDPVVVYDTFEDRWIISDFAFQLDGSNNVINPDGAFECFAVSKTGDPVSGGWNFYSINTPGGLGDYPKLGIWPDGLYMSVNMFGYTAGSLFQGVRVYAFNKDQMYAGYDNVQAVSVDVADTNEFTLLPANARLQTGTPPIGSPNYFAVAWQYSTAISVYKFQVDWDNPAASTFTGPFYSIATGSWSSPPSTVVTSTGGSRLDTLGARLMVQNQYTNISGAESLWDSHTVRGTAASNAAPRFYQVDVTGGTVAANTIQSFTHNPDASTLNRWISSIAVDRAGDMAMGYSASSASSFPSIRYAGRLVTDTLNTLPQTETVLYQGTGTQSGSIRWGDYSAMTLDPDGCTFWYTSEYYTTTGSNDLTRIGSFQYPACTVIGSGAITGTVVDASTSNPLSGVTVTFGSRITTTNGSGVYQFLNIPAGSYSSLSANQPGYTTSSVSLITVTQGVTNTQDFALNPLPTSGCYTDTSQTDFQAGAPTSNCDLTSDPGNVSLEKLVSIDQQNTTVTSSGFVFTSTRWAGQTFVAGISGQLTKVDLDLFCSGCVGTTPNITISIRATSGATPVPTGADLAVTTISGFSSGAGNYYSANFATPLTVTAGITYAVIMRPVSDPSAGNYAYLCSCSPDTNPYTNGRRVTSSNSGSSWAADGTAGGRDLGFKVYVKANYPAPSSANIVSSIKDASPLITNTARWTTLSWTATTPTSTTVQFQAAGSNSSIGPFDFVGPDGTSSTFFTLTGSSLSQFDGFRYLKYQTYLSTTNTLTTPMLSDVTVCYSNTIRSTAVSIVSSQNPVLSGLPLTFTLNVTSTGGTPTGAVQVYDNGVSFGAAQSLSGGSAVIVTTTLPIGSHTITATYSSNALFDGSAGALSTDQVVTSTATWNGNSSTDWNTLGNWNTNAAPDAAHTAYLPATGVMNQASTSSVVTITHLIIDTGRTLSLGGDLNISGNWSNAGTLTPNSNTVKFMGSNNTQTLSGATTFYNLTINHTGTGSVTATGSTLTVSNLIDILAGTFTSSSTYRDVQIESGATLASDGGTINVSGNWTNAGTFTASTGTVNFNGSTSATISGSSTTAFRNVIVNKGSNTTTELEATGPMNMSGNLTLTNGLFKLTHASAMAQFNTGPTIPSTAGIWINGGTLNGGNFSYTNNGLVRVLAGAATFGTNNGNVLTNGSAGRLVMAGGTLSVSGRLINSGGTITITGGTIKITTVSFTNATNAGFEMSVSSDLNMTGGTVEFQKANSGAGGDLKILNTSGTKSITGGTFQIGNALTAASQVFKLNSAIPIYNLTINNTNSPTGRLDTLPLTVTGSITINAGGTLDAATNNLNLLIGRDWTNNGTFNAGTATVTFNGAVEQTISGSSPIGFNNLTVASNSRVVIPDTNIPTVAGTLIVQAGGALKQTLDVNNAAVPFLQISTNKYRGVDLTTLNNLGSTTVVITTTNSQTCTTTGAGSPAYARRCYSITPTTNTTATVKLWALTSELNGILESTLAPYHYSVDTWVQLTNLSTGNDSGSYAFAQGDTLGFSPFLLGGPDAPTAITLSEFSATSTSNGYVWLLATSIVLALLIAGWRFSRRARN
jgi:hypothetical protein